MAERSDRSEVVVKTAGELDRAQGDQPCPFVQGCANVIDMNAPVASCYRADLDAVAGEVHPRVNIGGVFLRRCDHLVTRLPREALGNDANALAGVLDEGDV